MRIRRTDNNMNGGEIMLGFILGSLFGGTVGVFTMALCGAILKKWTAKSERWYNNKKRRERHGKHQVYRGIQAKHSKLV